jgi:type III pantothenate kinase
MTLLLVDVGNTRIKWILRDGDEIQQRGDLIHRGLSRSTLAERCWGTLTPPSLVLIANVAGPEMASTLASWIAQRWSVEARFVVCEVAGFGVKNAYQNPHRLGVDRWVALIGARASTNRPCCIVDCGTAITVDGLEADGTHLGGVIFPGTRLMREALYRNTRQVPPETGTVALFGNDTQDCVWGGTAHAAAGAIDRITRRMEASMGGEIERLLTGGDAERLSTQLDGAYRVEPDLLFEGLRVIATRFDKPHRSRSG